MLYSLKNMSQVQGDVSDHIKYIKCGSESGTIKARRLRLGI